MSGVLTVQVRVYSPNGEITKFVSGLDIIQEPHVYFQKAIITLVGWAPSASDMSGLWDVDVEGERVMSNAIVPPDGFDSGTLTPSTIGTVTVTIYDWPWIAQRVTGRSTWVVAQTYSECYKLVKANNYSCGAWSAVVASTMHDIVKLLAARCGMTVELQIPDYYIQPLILEPTKTLWQHIYDLTACFKPGYFFVRDKNVLIISDALHEGVGVFGTSVNIPINAITSASIKSTRSPYLRRVLVSIPPWIPDDSTNTSGITPGTH